MSLPEAEKQFLKLFNKNVPNFPKLKGVENFVPWKIKVWRFFTFNEVEKLLMDIDAPYSNRFKKQVVWCLESIMEPEVWRYVNGGSIVEELFSNPAGLWYELIKKYQTSKDHVRDLLFKINELTFKVGGFEDYYAEFTQLCDTFAMYREEKLSEDMRFVRLIMALPKEYRKLRRICEDYTFEELVVKIRKEEEFSKKFSTKSNQTNKGQNFKSDQKKDQQKGQQKDQQKDHQNVSYKKNDKKNDSTEKDKKFTRNRLANIEQEQKDQEWNTVTDSDSDNKSDSDYYIGFCSRENKWFPEYEFQLDSGAQDHFVNTDKYFHKFKKFPEGKEVKAECANGTKVPIIGYGDILLDNGLELKDVKYCPDLNRSYISTGRLNIEGWKVILKKKKSHIQKGSVRKDLIMEKNLYFLDIKSKNGKLETSEEKTSPQLANLWHSRMGHPGQTKTSLLRKIYPEMEIDFEKNCETCWLSKMKQLPYKASSSRMNYPLELIHTDIVHLPRSYKDQKYAALFLDDHSKYVWIMPLLKKNMVFHAFEEFKNFAEAVTGRKIKKIRSDCGTEFKSQEFRNFCAMNNILQEFSTVGCPAQNGAAERCVQTVMTKLRTLLKDGNLPKSIWPEVIQTACDIINATPHSATKAQPSVLFHGKMWNIMKMRRVGCVAYHWILKEQRSKLDNSAKKMIFVGYGNNFSAYRLFDPERKMSIISRNVKFDEEENFYQENQDYDIEEDIEGNEVGISNISNSIPKTYKQAMISKDSDKWKAAMDEEICSFKDHQVMEVVNKESAGKPLKGRWIFTKKDDLETKGQKFKARFVAKGYEQVEGKDFNETFSPVAEYSTILLAIRIALEKSWLVYHFDVKTAFLNGDLQEEIYLKPAEGYDTGGVWRLKRSLYGLKQAPRCWFNKLKEVFLKMECWQSLNDDCLFLNEKFFVVVYVDDMLVCGPDLNIIKNVQNELAKFMTIKNLGPVEKFCGLEMKKEGNKFLLSQEKMITKLQEEYNMDNISTKLVIPSELKTYEGEVESELPVRNLLGSLQYIASRTRPDINAAVNFLARYQSKPTRQLWEDIKKVLRYLICTKGKSLVIGGNYENVVEIFTDAAQPSQSEKAITGIVVKVFGSPVKWKSSKQDRVTTSTSEAELYAMSQGIDEGIWLNRLLEDFGIKFDSIVVKCDNQAALSAFKNRPRNNLKKVDLRTCHVLEMLKEGLFVVKYLPGEFQTADFLTKPFKLNQKERVWKELLNN